MQEWFDPIWDSATEFWQSIGEFLPKVLGALVLAIIGAVVAKLAATLTTKVLQLVRLEKFTKNTRVNKALKDAGVDWNWTDVLSRVVFWVVIVVFGMTIADVLALDAMRDTIRDLLAYIPNVLAAAIVVTLTVAGARLVKAFVTTSLRQLGVDFAGSVGTATKWAVIVFGSVLAADQLGFDTTILTTNLTIVVAGVMLALALAFGLGGRELAKSWLDKLFKG